ncbi:helix-turn-helix transcriptional regulator [uncultured Phycicoccus sp.]|uniref:helix-turn-helix transcriptional regulator n=1 Tax=uncultured Phycicoccus sp. TaxID=661422 RepID=UPI00260A7116|nr:helix-turn-helix transcriptional regulator [uncultured Phycicoccus sp.]
MLHGREPEQARLAALLDQARTGRGAVLVVLGEPGVGKTALLRDLTTPRKAGEDGTFRVVRTAGVESESPLPYSALHRLLRPVLDFDRLPPPQARALRLAFGVEDGPTVEPFLVGVATLSALTDAAEPDQPLLCVVDDAHWLDSASADALLFAARQLAADPVAMVFAARTGDTTRQPFAPPGLPVLEIHGLDDDAARQLLDERGGDPLPGEVAERLLRETGGNPLALMELPTGLSSAQLHGEEPLPRQLTLTAGVERAFLDRCRLLSQEVQTLLLVAAADATGRVATVRQAAATLGADATAWEDAERSNLLTISGDTVAVRHPLVRSAVYQAATSFEQRQAHRALAQAVGRDDPDRATWHRAAAADGPDGDVAHALADVAVRAEQRGGHLAAADAFERAAALTVNEKDRATRLFGAGRTAWAAGHAVRARALASSARELTVDPLQRADIDRLRARIEVNVGSAVDAHRIFTVAARTVADHDSGRALEMACAAALNRTYGADSGATLGESQLTHLLGTTDQDTPRTRCLRLLLRTLTASGEQDWGRATTALARALEAGREVEDLDVMGNLGNTALHLGHDEGARFYYSAMVSTAREAGAGMVVIYALERLMFGQLPTGAWTSVRSSADEALRLAGSVGQPTLTAAPLAVLTLLAALTGTDDFDHQLAAFEDVASTYPLGIMAGPTHDVTRWAKGAHATAHGDAPGALHYLSGMRVPALHRLAAVDRLEAAVRAGNTEQALAWVDELTPFATKSQHGWALGAVDLGRALTSRDHADATAGFERAVGHYRHASRPYDLARTQLAYGEFLRRTNRRVDARTHLRSALDAFADLGAKPLAERATQELRASGETARKRDPSTLLALTPMELKVAELVSTGLSNKDVAAQCWVSPRTVAFHLRNVFTKVGVSSRTELAHLDFS